MNFKNRHHIIRLGTPILIILLASFFILLVHESTLTLTHQAGFQTYEKGQIYLLSCRVIPSPILEGKIKDVQLKNPSGKPVPLVNESFKWQLYWDSKANIGALRTTANELEALHLLLIDEAPVKDTDGNYALVIAIEPVLDFDADLYKDYYFEIEYTVMGFHRSLKYRPFN